MKPLRPCSTHSSEWYKTKQRPTQSTASGAFSTLHTMEASVLTSCPMTPSGQRRQGLRLLRSRVSDEAHGPSCEGGQADFPQAPACEGKRPEPWLLVQRQPSRFSQAPACEGKRPEPWPLVQRQQTGSFPGSLVQRKLSAKRTEELSPRTFPKNNSSGPLAPRPLRLREEGPYRRQTDGLSLHNSGRAKARTLLDGPSPGLH